MATVRRKNVEEEAETASEPSTGARACLELVERLDAQTIGSLVHGSRVVEVAGVATSIPKLLFLGPRAGGTPIRVALLAGLNPNETSTTMGALQLLANLAITPAVARDFALFVYPVLGFGAGEFTERFAHGDKEGDVEFLRSEIREWNFDGIITPRISAGALGFYTRLESQVLAENVGAAAMDVLQGSLPVEVPPVRLRSAEESWIAKGLAAPGWVKSAAPQRFEVEVVAPAQLPAEERATGFFLTARETLRHYRRLLGHAPNI